MKTFFIALLILLMVSFSLLAQAPDWDWASEAGGSEDDWGIAIARDDSGYIYTTGYFRSTAYFGSDTLVSNGDDDIFVAKMNNDGTWIWAKKAGGYLEDIGYGITTDDLGNVYITGEFRNTAYFGSDSLISNGEQDIFIAKIDTDGNWIWAIKGGGQDYDFGNSITVDNYGYIYITGDFKYTAYFGSDSLTCSNLIDAFFSKIDSEGNWIWTKQISGYGNQHGRSIITDNTGNIFVAGYFSSEANFGSYTLSSTDKEDIFIAKMAQNGTWQWAKRAGGDELDRILGITLDNNGNIYCTGIFRNDALFDYHYLYSSGANDAFVAKIDTDGNWIWAIKGGGQDADYGNSITIDYFGNTYITGSYEQSAIFGPDTLTSTGYYDIYIASVDNNGNWLWAQTAGGDDLHDMGYGITIDDRGNTYTTGFFYGTAHFNTNTILSNGQRDIFVAKLESSVRAKFIANKTFGYLPLDIDFTDESISNIISWKWDFQNDGNYDSFQQNPTFTYTDEGIYDVKLVVSDGSYTDSLIRDDYITVEYVPPATPTGVQITIDSLDAIITWNPVDTTIYGTPITPDGYILLYCETADSVFYYLHFTSDTTYTHYRVAKFRDQMYYKVLSYIDLNKNNIEYLSDLNDLKKRISWRELRNKLDKVYYLKTKPR